MKRQISVLFALAVHFAYSQNAPTKPILRIETGQHTAVIRSIDSDASDRFLVSGSEDKTVRLWDLPSGRLVRTFRPPIGEGYDGRVNTVAISPDGRLIAVGGLTGSVSEKISIYLFERDSGHLYKRISGLPNVIGHLAYSPDGRFLVATLGAKNGIRLYRTADYTQVAEDRDYDGDSYGADFNDASSPSRSAWLITTSFDRLLRLYEVGANGSLRLVTKKKAPGGAMPHSVKFSPDGSRIALVFGDSAELNVLSRGDLAPICSPDTAGLNRSLSAVAWSTDGRFVYAGGRHKRNGVAPIVRWTDGGCGLRTEIAGSKSTIESLHPLHDGGLAFAYGDPAIGTLNSQGERMLFLGPPPDAELIQPSKFFVSSDGMQVCIGDRPKGDVPNCFSVTDRTLKSLEIQRDKDLHPPLTDGLAITEWEFSPTPKLNGTALRLGQYQRSRCLAIAPNKQQFLLGTDIALRMFDRTGVQRWIVQAPSTPGAVNITGDGRIAVAVFGDHTVRWYRMEDGKELLAVFVHSEKRWVLWTPSGYYDASPGGEDLIGWHIDHGRDTAADFFPASRFRATYYRPDIIGRLFGTLDETEATRLADAEIGRRSRERDLAKLAPPVVTILSPTDGAEIKYREITLRYEVRTPSGEPVNLVRVLVDGRPADVPRKLTVESASTSGLELRVSVPGRDSEVSLIAENRYAASEPATIRLRWRGEQRVLAKSKLFVLAIGISKYPEAFKLRWAAKDADDFAAAMQRQKGSLYDDVQVRVLTDEHATRDAIIEGLEWVEKITTQNDIGMLFLSGHGWNDSGGSYYFVPVNFQVDRLRSTAVSSSEVQKTVQSMAGKVVVFLDTCYSGNVLGSPGRELRGDINAVANELVGAENGAVVFTASTGRQVALERTEWGNGAFTKALMEGLGGKADMMGRGRITIAALEYYISERVRELTGDQQTPMTAMPHTIADFSIAVR